MRHRRSGDLHQIRPLDAAVLLRRVRLAAGLVLMAYLATHLLNHALGLISLATMEAGRDWFLAFWRHPVGTLALYGAFATHVVLALWSLYRRRHLRMPAWEAAQLLLGLLIPPLLVSHLVGTRLAHAWFDTVDSYTRVVLALWEQRPDRCTPGTRASHGLDARLPQRAFLAAPPPVGTLGSLRRS